MHTNIKKYFLAITIGLFFIAIASSAVVSAESGTDTDRKDVLQQQRLEQAQARREEQASKRISLRCEVFTTKTRTIIARYENNKGRHINAYRKIKTRIERLVNHLNEQGHNTISLTAHLQTLDNYIKTADAQYAEFAALLLESKELLCAEDEAGYRAKLQQARAQLQEVRKTLQQMHEFLRTTLRPEIKEIREQIKPESSPTND